MKCPKCAKDMILKHTMTPHGEYVTCWYCKHCKTRLNAETRYC